MGKVEFISYDGAYPCLCFGTLHIKVDGVSYHLNNVMVSGGGIYHDADWDYDVEEGDWSVELDDYPSLLPYKEEIERVVNDNVRPGCCGGCI